MRNRIMGWLAVGLLGLAMNPAWADHYWRGPRTSLHFGVQVGPPWVYAPPPYVWHRVYVPPVIVAPPPQTIYIERSPPPVASVPALEPGYWYYCREAGGYYPHVQQCPGDWHKVAPQPLR